MLSSLPAPSHHRLNPAVHLHHPTLASPPRTPFSIVLEEKELPLINSESQIYSSSDEGHSSWYLRHKYIKIKFGLGKMGRPPCCDKSNVKRGLWTSEEDKKILAYVSTHGAGNWASVPKKAGLKRCGKSCRLRWTNYLRPDLKHDDFTAEEEQMIITLHSMIGSRWSIIAQKLPGRTDNDVKNHWNTKLKKKLIQHGIDPVTHRPISHVVSSIQSLSKGGGSSSSNNNDNSNTPGGKAAASTRCNKQKDPRVSCLSRDMRSVFMSVPEPADAETSMPMQQALAYDWNPAWDLLAQLHAVKLVTDASKQTSTELSSFPHTEAPYSPYDSPFGLAPSQQESTAAAAGAPAPCDFSWKDFILQGGFPPLVEDHPQALSYTGTASGNLVADDVLGENLHGEHVDGGNEHCGGAARTERNGTTAESSSYVTGGDVGAVGDGAAGDPLHSDIDSFVESLLYRDDEMMWEFPKFLDDPFGWPSE